jgi:hypothetical protein
VGLDFWRGLRHHHSRVRQLYPRRNEGRCISAGLLDGTLAIAVATCDVDAISRRALGLEAFEMGDIHVVVDEALHALEAVQERLGGVIQVLVRSALRTHEEHAHTDLDYPRSEGLALTAGASGQEARHDIDGAAALPRNRGLVLASLHMHPDVIAELLRLVAVLQPMHGCRWHGEDVAIGRVACTWRTPGAFVLKKVLDQCREHQGAR